MKVTDDDEREHALERQDLRPAEGARAGGGARLLWRRRRGAVRRGRLVRHRRCRPYRPERLHADHRPRQGRHQVGRRMDFDHRPREPGRRPSRRRRGRGDRRAAFADGTSGRCWSSSASPAKAAGQDPRSSASWRARSRNGGCRTTSPSSSEIPHTATGKIQKTTLREQFKDYRLPTD